MYAHLQYMPHSFFTSEKQGDIITRMNSDIGGVSTVISGTLTSIVSNTATVLTTIIALFAMNWKLAIVGVAVIPLLILPTKKVGRTRFGLMMKSQGKQDEMNQLVNETLSVSGSLLVKLFAREQKEYQKFETINDQAAKISVKEESSGKWFRMIIGDVYTDRAIAYLFCRRVFYCRTNGQRAYRRHDHRDGCSCQQNVPTGAVAFKCACRFHAFACALFQNI